MPSQASAELAGAPSKISCTQRLPRASTAMALAAIGICLKSSRSDMLCDDVSRMAHFAAVCHLPDAACIVLYILCTGGLAALTLGAFL